MKCVLAIFLLAAGASGALLRKKSSLSRSQAQSEALSAKSRALDQLLQSVANKLKGGPTQDFLKTLHLCAPCETFERIGEDHDGGYVMCTDGLDQGLVGAYSYGINGFDGWGMSVASRYHIPLNEYDCTNANKPKVPKGFESYVHFHYECILENNGRPKPKFKTLGQQLRESGSGNATDRSLLLKIDVEAAEWKVFAREPVANLKKFREIVVEYHWISQKQNHPLYAQAVKRIEEAGFAVAHLHGNNYGGGLQYFGKYSIPNVIEVTYIQTPAKGCAADIPYHVPQDMTNNWEDEEVGDAVLPSKL